MGVKPSFYDQVMRTDNLFIFDNNLPWVKSTKPKRSTILTAGFTILHISMFDNCIGQFSVKNEAAPLEGRGVETCIEIYTKSDYQQKDHE
jgi:hypothetical protein